MRQTSIYSTLTRVMVLGVFFLMLGFTIEIQGQNQPASEDTVLLFSLPSPDEVLEYVGQNNVKFNKTLVLNTQLDRYTLSTEKYIAMGMLLTDLAYSVGFKQYGTSFKLFEAINTLGGELNVISPQIEKVKERFVDNMENQDSLKAIYYEVYEMVMMNFYENNRFNHYTLISAGIYVESIYLSLNAVDKTVQNREFKHRLWEQKMVHDHLSEMIEKNLDLSAKNKLKGDLKSLGDIYRKYSGNQAPETFEPKRQEKVIVIGRQQPTIDLEVAIPQLNGEIASIRQKWAK